MHYRLFAGHRDTQMTWLPLIALLTGCVAIGPVYACLLTVVLSPADRVVNGQDLELTCTHSAVIASTSTVYVNWIENGNIRGNIDNNCDDTFAPVDTTQFGFSCLSIRNYTWTIKSVHESRNNSVWTCSIQIDGQSYIQSDPTTIYVISPITSISIDGNINVSANAESQTTVSCTTSTGRPVSTIRWYFDAGTPSDTSDDEEITSTSEPVFDFGSETTSGSVTITAELSRNGWGIYATANNTESMTPIQSSRVTLTVTEIQSSTVSSTVISSTPGGFCYSCSNVRDPDACYATTICQADEACSVETRVVAGDARYSFGCRNLAMCKLLMRQAFASLDVCYGVNLTDPSVPQSTIDQCGNPVLIGKRDSRGIAVCNACCNDNNCNYGSCKQLTANTTTCYACDGVHDPNSCNHTTACQPNEVCQATKGVANGAAIYTFRCWNARQCKFLMQEVFRTMVAEPLGLGKRGYRRTNICDVCCDDDRCNIGNCAKLKETMYRAYKQGTFDLQSLKYTTTSR